MRTDIFTVDVKPFFEGVPVGKAVWCKVWDDDEGASKERLVYAFDGEYYHTYPHRNMFEFEDRDLEFEYKSKTSRWLNAEPITAVDDEEVRLVRGSSSVTLTPEQKRMLGL